MFCPNLRAGVSGAIARLIGADADGVAVH